MGRARFWTTARQWRACLFPATRVPPSCGSLRALQAVDPGRTPAPLPGQRSRGLTLARWGCLLPAVVSVSVDDLERGPLRAELESGAILTVTTQQVEAMASAKHPEFTEVSVGPVPLEDAENARFVSFRETSGIHEHVAVLFGSREEWPDPVPVRIHSACLAGDLFGSLRCDCGDQLRRSLQAFAAGGGGVLLYLGQAGWGITLGSRLRACSMQRTRPDADQADCTVDPWGADRRHEAAAEILRLLGVTRIQVPTNGRDILQAGRKGDLRVIDGRPTSRPAIATPCDTSRRRSSARTLAR